MPEQDHENADRGDLPDLGLRAYATDEHSNGDLLKNLEGRHVHRFSEGTREHAGTALMAVELSDDEMLGRAGHDGRRHVLDGGVPRRSRARR